jgi:hypothetical protein
MRKDEGRLIDGRPSLRKTLQKNSDGNFMLEAGNKHD